MYFLLIPGFYEPHDLHHFADIYEMARAISSGQFPPRLGPDFSFNYGYPLFNFYYVMPFYLGALIFFLFGSVILAFKGVFLLTILISVFGMYLFLRQFLTKWASLVGSLLFLYTPYRAVQIYVRGAMGEALALSLLPWVLFFIVKVVREPKKGINIAFAGLVSAVFILSHNYLWALTIPWLILFIILVFNITTIKKAFRSLLTSGLISAGLSAYWWLPALMEQKLVASTTPFPLIDHFPFIKQLIIPSWGYGSSVWGPYDGLSFQIGVVNLMVFMAILLILFLQRRQIKGIGVMGLTLWSVLGFIVSFVMMNSRTYFIWKIIPFHDFIQFPWRLLIFTAFFTSISGALVTEMVKRRKLAGLLILVGSIVLTFSYFRPSQIFYKSDNNYLSRFFANRTLTGIKDSVSSDYLGYSEDYLLLPKWTDKRPISLPDSKVEVNDGTINNIKEINPVDWKAEVTANNETLITFNTYYFPGWQAKVDGKDTNLTAGKPFGQIELKIDKGNHLIQFFWKETRLRKIADFITLLSLVIVIFLLLTNIRFRKQN
jgi:hypothetical protein